MDIFVRSLIVYIPSLKMYYEAIGPVKSKLSVLINMKNIHLLIKVIDTVGERI